MPLSKTCKSCVHWRKDKVKGPGTCTLNPQWVGTDPDHYCSRIEYPKIKKSSRKYEKRDSRIAKLINYYIKAYEHIHGDRPLIHGVDKTGMRNIADGRTTEEVEWIITEFLNRPPATNHRRGGSISAMFEALRSGYLINRNENEGRQFQLFLDSQLAHCDDPDKWDQYEAWTKDTGIRITFNEWLRSGPKEE